MDSWRCMQEGRGWGRLPALPTAPGAEDPWTAFSGRCSPAAFSRWWCQRKVVLSPSWLELYTALHIKLRRRIQISGAAKPFFNFKSSVLCKLGVWILNCTCDLLLFSLVRCLCVSMALPNISRGYIFRGHKEQRSFWWVTVQGQLHLQPVLFIQSLAVVVWSQTASGLSTEEERKGAWLAPRLSWRFGTVSAHWVAIYSSGLTWNGKLRGYNPLKTGRGMAGTRWCHLAPSSYHQSTRVLPVSHLHRGLLGTGATSLDITSAFLSFHQFYRCHLCHWSWIQAIFAIFAFCYSA